MTLPLSTRNHPMTTQPHGPVPSGFSPGAQNLMPAEWEHHDGTWLAWPHNEETWPGKLAEVEHIWLQMIEALGEGETIHLLLNEHRTEKHIRKKLRQRKINLKNIRTYPVSTVDVWLRDTGPIFIRQHKGDGPTIAACQGNFNAWGQKYREFLKDRSLPKRIASAANIPLIIPDFTFEGGAVEVNGQGSCLTTESCLLNKNRNSRFSRSDVEKRLHQFLGIQHVVWLPQGLEGDDTDGHIDRFARFVNANTILCARARGSGDPNYKALEQSYKLLKEARNQNGKTFEVLALPTPSSPITDQTRKPLPADYANFYIGNNVVLVPTYGDAQDDKALGILKDIFPGRKIIGIHSASLIIGLGALHCVTLQQPSP